MLKSNKLSKNVGYQLDSTTNRLDDYGVVENFVKKLMNIKNTYISYFSSTTGNKVTEQQTYAQVISKIAE